MKVTRLLVMILAIAAPATGMVPASGVAGREASAGEDEAPFAPGWSMREYGGRKYEIVVPEGVSRASPCSLILAISVNGRDDIARDFEQLVGDGWITCAPKTRYTNKGAGENWATNEAPELLELVDHLCRVLPIGEGRVHAVAVRDWAGFFPFVAFSKDAHFVSACFAGRCAFRGGNPPRRAREEMGVLVLGAAPMDELPADQRIVPALEGKVRSVEFRSDTTEPAAAYPAYWRGVMEGRYTPGRDLSFDWREPADRNALTALLSPSRARGFLYFFSETDAGGEAGRRLQNETFFDPQVRSSGASLVPIKLDRARHEALFDALGLEKTPAIAVVDGGLAPLGVLQGDISTSAARKLLRRFAPSRRGSR